jgi:hypothetical protein
MNARSSSRPVPSRLALTPEEAAAALGIGRSAFFEHVAPHVRVVRVGSRRVYPVRDLERYLDLHAALEADGR